MNEEDRERITVNCAKLIPQINWPQIFPKLIEHGIYRKEDKNLQRWEKNLDNESNNREIYLRIRNRGPRAFEKFILCLKETGHDNLAKILKPEDCDQVSYDENQSFSSVNTNSISVNCHSIRSESIKQVHNGERAVLSEVSNYTVIENDDPITDETLLHRSDCFYRHLQKTERPLQIHVRKATEFMCSSSSKVMCYSMSSNPRGLVLIINNILFAGEKSERRAAEHDETNLKDLFEQMGFKVKNYRDLTRAAMLETISAFSKERELRHVHSMFVIIMSHGSEHVKDNRPESVVFGSDDEVVMEQEILNFFTAQNCVDMCKKPKVFIFQTCRGDKTQNIVISEAVSRSRDCTDIRSFTEKNLTGIPMGCRDLSDVLVTYSTLPGYVAHRDIHTGSWYIQTLCEVIMNHAYNTELLRLLQMTDDRLSNMHNDYKACQTSVFMNYGFNRECYLNPGLFVDQTDG